MFRNQDIYGFVLLFVKLLSSVSLFQVSFKHAKHFDISSCVIRHIISDHHVIHSRDFLPEELAFAKVLPECVLLNIKSSTLSTKTGHLDSLQWCHLLLDQHCLLFHIVPLVWQLL